MVLKVALSGPDPETVQGIYKVAFPVDVGRDEKVKYLDVYGWIMNFRMLSSLIVVLIACSLCAACTSTGETSGPSPTPTPAVTATPAPTAPGSLTPGPTQTMPPGKEIEFQITGGFPSRVTNDLTIEFRGGKGQEYVTKIDVRVTKASGEIVTDTLQPRIGDSVTISHAKGDNRVEITAALVTGGSYKVHDEIVAVP